MCPAQVDTVPKRDGEELCVAVAVQHASAACAVATRGA